MDNVSGSFPGSEIELPGSQHTYKSFAAIEGNLVSLMQVVRENLVEMRPQTDNLQAIIRYDSLPIVLGKESDLNQLFKIMLHAIIDHPPVESKLFIYIRSESLKSDVMNLQVPEGFGQIAISVYTNIIADASWKQLHKKEIEKCGEIINSMHGNFTCHEIVNTGCLFDIELNGKLN